MPATARGVIQWTRIAVHRAAVRRQLQAVLDGRSETVDVDLADTGIDLAALIRSVAGVPRPTSLPHQRLAAAFHRSRVSDLVVDQLGAKAAEKRVQSARIAGMLAMEQTVTLLSPLLSAKEPAVRNAAARALGRIGGTRSAETLLQAMRRRGPSRTLVVELARAAPDLFLEVALCAPQRVGIKPALAVAAGLRRHHAAVVPLLALLDSGSRRERAASCRALGWIGARSAAPSLADSLKDTDWRVRISAAKALLRLGEDAYVTDLEALISDQDQRVRKVALAVHRGLYSPRSRGVWGWSWR